MNKIRVTVWNEFRHEKNKPEVAKVYPDGIHNVIADFLRQQERFDVRTATLDEPDHGLTDEIIDTTDVLIWWGHKFHKDVSDEVVEKICRRILWGGMGFIALHSSHLSKVFLKMVGTTALLKWREIGEKERLWVIEPGHRIAEGLHEYFELPYEEMYGERFDIPAPDELVFISWFEGGEVFRSGCCYNRGRGKIFYFRPGHESFPTYYDPNVQRVISNAIEWAKPVNGPVNNFADRVAPLEKIRR